MPSWRTCNNRRRRKPWWQRPRYLGMHDGHHLFIVLPSQYRDLMQYGQAWTRSKADGTPERIDPLDVYPQL